MSLSIYSNQSQDRFHSYTSLNQVMQELEHQEDLSEEAIVDKKIQVYRQIVDGEDPALEAVAEQGIVHLAERTGKSVMWAVAKSAATIAAVTIPVGLYYAWQYDQDDVFTQFRFCANLAEPRYLAATDKRSIHDLMKFFAKQDPTFPLAAVLTSFASRAASNLAHANCEANPYMTRALVLGLRGAEYLTKEDIGYAGAAVLAIGLLSVYTYRTYHQYKQIDIDTKHKILSSYDAPRRLHAGLSRIAQQSQTMQETDLDQEPAKPGLFSRAITWMAPIENVKLLAGKASKAPGIVKGALSGAASGTANLFRKMCPKPVKDEADDSIDKPAQAQSFTPQPAENSSASSAAPSIKKRRTRGNAATSADETEVQPARRAVSRKTTRVTEIEPDDEKPVVTSSRVTRSQARK